MQFASYNAVCGRDGESQYINFMRGHEHWACMVSMSLAEIFFLDWHQCVRCRIESLTVIIMRSVTGCSDLFYLRLSWGLIFLNDQL